MQVCWISCSIRIKIQWCLCVITPQWICFVLDCLRRLQDWWCTIQVASYILENNLRHLLCAHFVLNFDSSWRGNSQDVHVLRDVPSLDGAKFSVHFSALSTSSPNLILYAPFSDANVTSKEYVSHLLETSVLPTSVLHIIEGLDQFWRWFWGAYISSCKSPVFNVELVLIHIPSGSISFQANPTFSDWFIQHWFNS